MARKSEYTINGLSTLETAAVSLPQKSLSIRREQRNGPTDLRALYRHSADSGLPREESATIPSQNGIPSTPALPPTPPAVNGESTADESVSEGPAYRSPLVTPVNQYSPPTPENTPPRDQRLPFARPFLGTQTSLVSTRAESFRTAQEDFVSEDEAFLQSPNLDENTPQARSQPSRTHIYVPSSLSKDAMIGEGRLADVENTTAVAHGPSKNFHQIATASPKQPETLGWELPETPACAAPGLRETASPVTEEVPLATEREEVLDQSVEEIRGNANLKPLGRGPSLRDRLRAAEEFSPSASTERFANIIGWSNSVDMPEEKRASGMSTISTISAMVIESSPPQRKPSVLRKVAKNDSLRSASSPLPNSHRRSLASSSGSPHRLVHKKVRLNNGCRLSFGSEDTRSRSMSSSITQPREVIKVAVIPERISSLPSSAVSSRRHSISGTSHQTQVSKGSNNLPPSSWQHKATKSDSNDRGRSPLDQVAVPPRSSSLSAPTSQKTSRANSIISDSVRVERRRAEKDLRKTLDRMESDRLLTSLQKVQNEQTGDDIRQHIGNQEQDYAHVHLPAPLGPIGAATREPPSLHLRADSATYKQQRQTTPSSSEWAALRPPSVLETPFSQPSYQSASPEINEATAINFFPHNNYSLQIIEPNVAPESRAVRQVHKDDYLVMGTQSPLRNPRPPPEPPMVNVLPPGPADEVHQHAGMGRRGSARRQPSQPRSESFIKTLSRGLSLKNAKNKKASQDLDGHLHPFWRPQPFWDDNEHAVEGEQQRSLGEFGPVNNSLGFPQSSNVTIGPVSLIRRISDRRKQNKAVMKQSSQSSLARMRARKNLYQKPFLGINLRLMGMDEIQERMFFAKQRKEDERRERRREALRQSIGANVVSQGDSRFPANGSSLIKV